MIESTCVFCKIVAGREPASVVHEDDDTVAFMIIRPTHPGELTVIPKQHIDHFCDLPDSLAARIMIVGQRLSRAVRDEFQPTRVGYVVHGFGVPHAHLVVVPLREPGDITNRNFIRIENGEVVLRSDHLRAPPRDELDAVALRIRARLGGSQYDEP